MASGCFYHAVDLSKTYQLILLLSTGLCILGGYAVAAADMNNHPMLSILDSRVAAENIKPFTTATLTVEAENLVLKAHLAGSLAVPDQAIHWQINNAQGVQVQTKQGKEQLLKLAAGEYQIKLSIGQFTTTKQVVIKDKVISKPYFKADLGRLEVVANHAADWTIISLSHADISFEIKATQQLDAWIPAGFYELKPTHAGAARRQVVNVLAGDISRVNINIPVVQVNLIAVENNQPFFKPVDWDVFRLEQGERQHIGSYHQHSQGITVPTGYYEVVATHAEIVRSRQFWVKENTTNKIVLAMD